MSNDGILKISRDLFKEIEEEDIAISLFTAFCANDADLRFFSEEDQAEVKCFLKILINESTRHKQILERITDLLQRRAL